MDTSLNSTTAFTPRSRESRKRARNVSAIEMAKSDVVALTQTWALVRAVSRSLGALDLAGPVTSMVGIGTGTMTPGYLGVETAFHQIRRI